MSSSRPPQIRVRMVGEVLWASKVARFLEDKFGDAVESDTAPPVNGHVRDAHVLIVNSQADPGFKYLRDLREKWSERDLPVIVVGENDDSEVEAMSAGASAFLDESMHQDGRLLEKLVYGLAYEG